MNETRGPQMTFPLVHDEGLEDKLVLLSLFHFWPKITHEAISLVVEHFRPLARVLEVSSDDLRRFFSEHRNLDGFLLGPAIANRQNRDEAVRFAERQITYMRRLGRGKLLFGEEGDFPTAFARSSFPVRWLFCHPRLPGGPRPFVAVIGSRRSSRKQLAVAAEAAQLAQEHGGSVITGLATGADAAAHEAGMKDAERVVAVLGSGLKKVYPKEHEPLAHELISRGGTILTEVPPSVPGNAKSFILRNRIVATLADVVVVASGRYASGTAHTVRFAADAGTPVLCVDPDERSGIARLVEDLGGSRGSVVDLAALLEGHAQVE